METCSYPPSTVTPLAAVGDDFVSSLREGLPDYEDGVSLLDSYMLHCHTLVPICDAKSLKNIVPLLWCRQPEQITVELAILILAVLYAAASISQDAIHSRHAQTFSRLYTDLTRKLEFDDYFIASPSMPLLQAFVLRGTFRACRLAPFAAFGFLPQAIRFAKILGLHKDKEVQSPIERELRRRTWWHLVFLDVEATTASGMQTMIRPNGHDTHMLSPMTEDLGVPHTAEDDSPVLVAIEGHWLLAKRIHTWLDQRPSHDEILKFGCTIKNLSSRIRGDSAIEFWARLYLRLQIDRAYCMLGLRSWELDQFKAISCHGEVASTARSFLRNYLDLIKLGRGIGYGWFAPGFLQPLHALVILLKHLSVCTNRESESSAGSYDLITQVIHSRREWIMRGSIRPLPPRLMPGLMSNSEGRSPDGGSVIALTDPRYRMLWTLKERVWQRFGWASQEQTMIVTTPNIDALPEGQFALGYPTGDERHYTFVNSCQSVSGHQTTLLTQQDVSAFKTPDYLEDSDSNSINISKGGDTRDGMFFDRYFNIGDLVSPNLLNPVDWDSWLLGFNEDNPSSHDHEWRSRTE